MRLLLRVQMSSLQRPRDDYFGLGSRQDVSWFKDELSKRLIIKDRGTLGSRPEELKQIRMLNRVITYHPASGNKPEA